MHQAGRERCAWDWGVLVVVSPHTTLCCPGPPRSPWRGSVLLGEGEQGLPQLRGLSWRVRCHRDCCGTRVWLLHQGQSLTGAHGADVEGGFVRDRPGVTLLWPERLWQGTLPPQASVLVRVPSVAAGRLPVRMLL